MPRSRQWVGLYSERPFGEWFASVATPELVAKNGAADPRNLARWPLLAEAGDWRRLLHEGKVIRSLIHY